MKTPTEWFRSINSSGRFLSIYLTRTFQDDYPEDLFALDENITVDRNRINYLGFNSRTDTTHVWTVDGQKYKFQDITIEDIIRDTEFGESQK